MRQIPPSHISDSARVAFLRAGGISLVAWGVLTWLSPPGEIPWTAAMLKAAGSMEEATGVLASHCRAENIPIDPGIDPNGTCLVGPEYSELLTSLGQLESKRTTTNPDLAGLLVYLLSEAGVETGERVGIGASGSFPGLMMASLAAVEALDAEPVVILSLGASSYGATRPELNLLDLYRLLEREGFASAPPAAVSLGGSGDRGEEFDPAFRAGLLEMLGEEGVLVVQASGLLENVAQRMAVYGFPASGDETGVQAFVNIGGAESNLGTSPEILSVPPGPVKVVERAGGPTLPEQANLPPPEQRGVLFEMVSRGIPTLHLLHVRGLALRYGLAWDPLPIPPAGSSRLSDAHHGKGPRFWILTAAYLLALWVVAFRRPQTVR